MEKNHYESWDSGVILFVAWWENNTFKAPTSASYIELMKLDGGGNNIAGG